MTQADVNAGPGGPGHGQQGQPDRQQQDKDNQQHAPLPSFAK